MPFDQATRNRLARFVGEARDHLKVEFTRQLQNEFAMDPATGATSELSKLTHLDDARRETARILRETMDHYLAGLPTKAKGSNQEVLDRIVREQAFTVLNRICALRMAEARGLLVESIGKGYQSKGFRLYAQVAGNALGETGDAYRCYLFSIFDEFALDLAALFDRFSVQGRLFPRESTLLELMDLVNHPDLEPLWAEDETIGWIYQYFNSKEERKKMRDDSAAPRNSRELAVRNQFFTPRYVVEFLTDNTLGRIWYEMRQGNTRLKDTCRYMVRRPDEVFLGEYSADTASGRDVVAMAKCLTEGTEADFPLFEPTADHVHRMIQLAHCVDGYQRHPFEDEVDGEWWPTWKKRLIEEQGTFDGVTTQDLLDILFAAARADRHGGGLGEVFIEDEWLLRMANEVRRRALDSRRENLSHEELLRQPVFIPYREMKDPRELRILDPACGSGHFLLYAFDLLEQFYEEAWGNEHGPGSVASHGHASIDELRRAIPKLIIEHNLHGIDIDPRAVQIASLSLWMRAQRYWHAQGISPQDRARVTRSNIVCGEPMPGEQDLLEEFIKTRLSSTAEDHLVAQLVRRVFDAMKLAGEAGSLLKIEEEIATDIAEARRKWIARPKEEQGLLFADESPRPKQQELGFDVSGITDETFWEQVEERIYTALKAYAERAESGDGFRRKLFVQDAARGFSFIDVCRKRYDVALMNPPFGDLCPSAKPRIAKKFISAKSDIYACFVSLGCSILHDGGRLGVLSSRTGFFLPSLENWRIEQLLGVTKLELVADLGLGVLDAAMVEAAAYTISRTNLNWCRFFSCLASSQKEAHLYNMANGLVVEDIFLRKPKLFKNLPQHVVAYWITDEIAEIFRTYSPIEGNAAQVRIGLQTSDDFRFLRLHWEVHETEIGRGKTWVQFAKGGEYQLFYDDIHLLVNWASNAAEMKGFAEQHAAKTGSMAGNGPLREFEFYFKGGLTYPERTTSEFGPRLLPDGCITGTVGPGLHLVGREQRALLLGWLSTRLVRELLEIGIGMGDAVESGSAARHYNVRLIGRTPFPKLESIEAESVSAKVSDIVHKVAFNWSCDETSRNFTKAISDMSNGIALAASSSQMEYDDRAVAIIADHKHIEDIFVDSFSEATEIRAALDKSIGRHPASLPEITIHTSLEIETAFQFSLEELVDYCSKKLGYSRQVSKKSYIADRRIELIALMSGVAPKSIARFRHCQGLIEKNEIQLIAVNLVSSIVGLVFGRWDVRYLTRERSGPELPDPFAPLPVCPPGMLLNGHGLPAGPDDVPDSYPISIPWDGELVDDPNHPLDIERRVREVIEIIWKDRAEAIEHEACEILGVTSLREYFRKPGSFFADHLKRYSKSRRQAPIYWPLSTPSCSYTLWIYYHRLTDQTLYTAVNDFVEPKLKQVSNEAAGLRANSARSSADERELERLSTLEFELTDFRDELLRIAQFWRPNLNDGVQITAAPLWKLFQHRPWKTKLKETWDDLESGKYDWAHLALSIWPDRVVKASHKDRSFAIAHNLENELWEEAEVVKKTKGGKSTKSKDWRPKNLSDTELNAIIASVKQR